MSAHNNASNYDLNNYVSDLTELCSNAMAKYCAPLSEMSLLWRLSMVNVCHRERRDMDIWSDTWKINFTALCCRASAKHDTLALVILFILRSNETNVFLKLCMLLRVR